MAMADDPASIGGIYFHHFCNRVESERRARIEVADNCLQMSVQESATRCKPPEPRRHTISRSAARRDTFLGMGRLLGRGVFDHDDLVTWEMTVASALAVSGKANLALSKILKPRLTRMQIRHDECVLHGKERHLGLLIRYRRFRLR